MNQEPISTPSFDEVLAVFDAAKAQARIDSNELQADRTALLAVYKRLTTSAGPTPTHRPQTPKYSKLLHDSFKYYGITEFTKLPKQTQRFIDEPELRPCTKPCTNKLCNETVEHGRYVFIHCESCKETKAFDQAEGGWIRGYTEAQAPRKITWKGESTDEICKDLSEWFNQERVRRNAATIQKRIVDWAEATFPNQPTSAKIDHLADEVQEVRDNPNDGEELADCAILLFNLAGRAGVDLMTEIEKKFAKNVARKWGSPDARGVVNHIKE